MGRTGDFAFCASLKIYYFGYNLHTLCGLSGVIQTFELSKANIHNINYPKDVKQEFCNVMILGDKAYISEDIQLNMFETANINLECPYREKLKN